MDGALLAGDAEPDGVPVAVGVDDTVPDGVAGAVAMAVGVDKAVLGMGVVVAVGVWPCSRRRRGD